MKKIIIVLAVVTATLTSCVSQQPRPCPMWDNKVAKW